MGTELNIEWPEAYGPEDGHEIVASILAAFRERCALDLTAPDTRLLLVADPPQSARTHDWIREHLPADVDLTSFSWGHRGLAYLVRTPAHFGDCIRVFLAMHTTTLSILFVHPRDARELSTEAAATLIDEFLSNRSVAVPELSSAGMFFDMGVLRSFSCTRAVS